MSSLASLVACWCASASPTLASGQSCSAHAFEFQPWTLPSCSHTSGLFDFLAKKVTAPYLLSSHIVHSAYACVIFDVFTFVIGCTDYFAHFTYWLCAPFVLAYSTRRFLHYPAQLFHPRARSGPGQASHIAGLHAVFKLLLQALQSRH